MDLDPTDPSIRWEKHTTKAGKVFELGRQGDHFVRYDSDHPKIFIVSGD